MSILQNKAVLSETAAKNLQVSSTAINELRKMNAELKAQVEAKNQELDQALSIETARKVQAAHDKAEAIKSKVSPQDDKTGVSIIRNGITNQDIAEAGMLCILNAERNRKGLEPYKSYAEYLDAQTDPTLAPVKQSNVSCQTQRSSR